MDKKTVVYAQNVIIQLYMEKILIHATIWMTHKIIMLREETQIRKRILKILFIQNSDKCNLVYSDRKYSHG